MNRAGTAFLGCLAGTALMVWLKVAPPGVIVSAMSDGHESVDLAPVETTTTPPPSDGVGLPAPSDSAGLPSLGASPGLASTAQSPRPTETSSKKVKSPLTPSRTAPTKPAGVSGSFRGPAVTDPYGKVQVTVVLSQGRIVDVTATYPTDGLSAGINKKAIPALRQEVLRAQSAHVDNVSGATYTSEAYVKSLQAALDTAHF